MAIYTAKEAKAFGKVWGKGTHTTTGIRKAAGKVLGLKGGVRKMKVSAWKAAVHPGKVPKMPFQAEQKHIFIVKYGGIKGKWRQAGKDVMQYPTFKKRRMAKQATKRRKEEAMFTAKEHFVSKNRYCWKVSFDIYSKGVGKKKGVLLEEGVVHHICDQKILRDKEIKQRLLHRFKHSPVTIENIVIERATIDRHFGESLEDY